MDKKTIFLIIAILFNSPGYSQVANTQNQVYAQFFGNGLLASLNYERKILNKIPLYSHVGIGVYGTDKFVTLPLGLKYLYQPTKSKLNFLTFGIGGTYTKAEVFLYTSLPKYADGIMPKNSLWNFLPSIGYRGISKKQFVLSADLLLLYNIYHKGLPYIGFSIGKAF